MGGGEVLKKGWLIKSPPLESGGLKNWRKRFFRLRSSKILEYYKSEDGDLKGVINLEDCKAVNSDLYHKKYKYVFGIETYDRVYYLVASSAEEMTTWVDSLTNVCGFTLRPSMGPADQPQSSKTMGSIVKGSKNDAVISPPVSTLPHNVSAPLLNEKFRPEDTQTDVYSLASAAIYDTQTKLGRGTEVPAGIPLSDALAAKGMVTPSPISSIYSLSTGLPESAYFSPRAQDPSTLYAVPQKKTKVPKQHSVESGLGTQASPRHKPLTATQSDASAMLTRESSEEQVQLPSSSLGYRPAETMSNGYMCPSQWGNRPRPANYDYVTGPPRPADGTTPPHQSPPLRGGEDPQSTTDKAGEGSRTYVNMRELHDEIRLIEAPPQIDRSTKPNSSPPRIDRGLKPGANKTQLDPSSSPPEFPTRTGSVSAPPISDAGDLPRPTRRTMKYTQVEFDSSGQMSVVDNPSDSTPVSGVQRPPVPVPRGQGRAKKVNYSEIDLAATQAMAETSPTRTLSLNEAEIAALAEKPYVNVARDGLPDDDTDPDYYTHMRDLPADSLLYVVLSKNGEDNEDLYQEPRETMAN